MSYDEESYKQLQEEQEAAWEALCSNCGACCGALGDDPCENVYHDGKRFLCRVYDNRFGLRKTINGVEFNCVPLRYIIHQSWPGDQNCSYKKDLKRSVALAKEIDNPDCK
jgi:uncharacterized cysteine cluster protein YcgN (CxxCxxCC family)